MPNRDGWSVLADLKSAPEISRVPIIVCSIIEDESKGFSLGAADYLVKPITESELLRALDRVEHRSPVQTVLVVDDEPDAVRLVRRVLESRSGYRVLEAMSGAQAIAAVKDHRPEVVLLDLMMPDIDGFGVLEQMKSNSLTRNIPVIVITAKELTEEDRTRLQGQVTALFSKGGLNAEHLLSEIAAALSRLSGEDRQPISSPIDQKTGQAEIVTIR
jgi:CheY-like chemotaxis protein